MTKPQSTPELYEVFVPLPESNSSLRVKYERKPPSAHLRALFEQIEAQHANPFQALVNWRHFYVQFTLHLVRWWDLVDDNGEMIPLTPEGLAEVPTFVLQHITKTIINTEQLMRPEVVALFRSVDIP